MFGHKPVTGRPFHMGDNRPLMNTSAPNQGARRLFFSRGSALVKQHGFYLVIAGGGTGGHLFPGIAIAEELLARHTSNRVRFVGTGNVFETSVLASKGFAHEKIRVQGLKGRGLVRQMSALLEIPGSIRHSMAILKRERPDMVLGLGGYSAGPVVIGAWMLRIPRVLHEQNVLPGITNRLLARLADRIYASFDNTRFKGFEKKIRITGNPVRKEFLQSIDRTGGPHGDRASQDHHPFTVMVAGGSQGAHGINLAVVESLAYFADKKRFAFIHQTGAADESWVRKAYADHGVTATVGAFFDDMSDRYHRSDMVICRAGATTIAELTVMGKGVLFVPFPHAADDHQALNAQSLVSREAADMVREADLDGELLARKIESYAASPEKLRTMAANAGRLGRPRAAHAIVEDMVRLIGGA